MKVDMAVCVIVEFGKVGSSHRQGLKINVFIVIRDFWCIRKHFAELWYSLARVVELEVRIEGEDSSQSARQRSTTLDTFFEQLYNTLRLNE